MAILLKEPKYLQGRAFGQEFLIREDFRNELMRSIILGRPNAVALMCRLVQELSELNENGKKPLNYTD